jgi:hypothetical protein
MAACFRLMRFETPLSTAFDVNQGLDIREFEPPSIGFLFTQGDGLRHAGTGTPIEFLVNLSSFNLPVHFLFG